MIVVIDNYDSFTYNLVQYLGELGAEPRTYRNDAIDVDGVRRLAPAGIVLSPGPGTPDQAGITLALIRSLGGEVPILGVCLGHQAIGQALGGSVVHAPRLMHGKVSEVLHDGTGIHRGLPSPFTATRYHSLVVDPASIPPSLRVTAWSREGDVMGLEHREYPIVGVQYHPESILTEHGHQLLRTFLELTL